MLRFICNYGPFKVKDEVTAIGEGYDYYRIRHHGTIYSVPMIVVSKLRGDYDAG